MNITHKIITSGQPRAYADSVLIAEVTAPAEATDAEVWTYCQTIRKTGNRADHQSHDGSCGFPFGLSSYGSLRKQNPTTYRYLVTEPYCD